VDRETKRWLPPTRASAARRCIGWFLTINFVCLAWILFRAADFGTALTLIRNYLMLQSGGSSTLPLWLTALPPVLLVLQHASQNWHWPEKLVFLEERSFALAYGAAWAFVVALLPLAHRPFIYFQF